MAIEFRCDCGRKFRTADEHAGRNATCPECRANLIVPAASVEAAGRAPRTVSPPPVPDDPQTQRGNGYNLQAEEVVPVSRRSGQAAPYGRDREDDRDDDRGRPYDRRPPERNPFVKRTPPTSQGWSDKGVLAGLGMMVGAVVWFFGGLYFDIIFYYPPILFIIGLVCFIKGLATGRA